MNIYSAVNIATNGLVSRLKIILSDFLVCVERFSLIIPPHLHQGSRLSTNTMPMHDVLKAIKGNTLRINTQIELLRMECI